MNADSHYELRLKGPMNCTRYDALRSSGYEVVVHDGRKVRVTARTLKKMSERDALEGARLQRRHGFSSNAS